MTTDGIQTREVQETNTVDAESEEEEKEEEER